MFTIYYSDVTGMPSNCNYPHKKEIVDEGSLKDAISHDYVCAEYKNSYRSGDNFIGSNCLPVDCDNDHSDNQEDWITPNDVMQAFPGVAFAIHYSRSNNKAKNGKAARPKFHVLFPIDYETNAAKYKEIKQKVNSIFPYFDSNALDAARFFFGTKEGNVEIYQGDINLTQYLNAYDFEEAEMNRMPDGFVIKEGSRNSTLSHFAGRVIKKYGDTEKAYEVFMEKAALCDPPLDDEELASIWNSAKKFYKKLSSQEGYVDPEQYNQDFNLEPLDYSDVGQATVLAKEYESQLKYSPSTDFLVYNGSYWEESRSKAQAISQELTSRQLEEAEVGIKKLTDIMLKNGAWDILASVGPKKAVALFNEEQANVYKDYEDVTAYRKYAIKRRDSKYIYASLKEVRFDTGSKLSAIKSAAVWNNGWNSAGAFENCSALISITIPKEVERIEGAAFRGCSSLTEVNFEQGSKLQYISRHRHSARDAPFGAFDGCPLKIFDASNCTELIAIANALEGGNISLLKLGTITPPTFTRIGTSSNAILKVPDESVDAYENSSWAYYFSNISGLSE